MKKIALVVSLLLLGTVAFAGGLQEHKAAYIGGTASIQEGTVGTCSAKGEGAFVFAYAGGALTIPYDRINSLEYGQKAGRRLGVAIVLTPAALLSKKRRHFLTIDYKDAADKQQAVVLELGKGIVRPTLAALEARTGQKVEFQDDEARKAGYF